MKSDKANVTPFPATDWNKRAAALERDMDVLVDVFRELHQIERMTGRAGLSADVLISIMRVLMSAANFAKESV